MHEEAHLASDRAASMRMHEHSPHISTVQFTDPLV